MDEQTGGEWDEAALDHATRLAFEVCTVAGDRAFVATARRGLVRRGVVAAIAARDDRRLFDWLMDALSFQGIADTIAANYIAENGQATAADLEAAQARPGNCPKLKSYWHFEACRFRKAAHTCALPAHLPRCLLPALPLRNGQLNQMAFSLWLFMRDVAGGDFVGWIDRRLDATGNDARAGLVEPLRHVHGVSDKILNMTLSDLLLGGDKQRPGWLAAGGRMIAVDTLVHNWLHRTGILRDLGVAHPYGAACYGPRGCEAVLAAIARGIDARVFNRRYPALFPRFVQNALWRFCAQTGLDRCNGNRIDDRAPCRDDTCPLTEDCGHVALR